MPECEWEDFAGHILLGRYTLRSLLAAGQGQAEFAASSDPPAESGTPFSVTLIIPGEADLEQQLLQIQTAKRLVHPNVLRILDGGQCTLNGTALLFVAAETAPATLAEVIARGRLDSAEGAVLIKDILSGLAYIHGSGFLCGSLEPETIVRAGGVWKIGDLSKLTPAESSVEQLGSRTDTGMLGTTLRAALAEEVLRIPMFDEVIRRCLEPDPAKRLSAEEIGRLLESQPPTDAVHPEARASRQKAIFAPGSILTLAVALVAILLLFAVLARLVFRKQPTPARASSAVARAPAQAVVPPDSRPSPFSSHGDATGHPAPQPHLPPTGTVPSPAPPQASRVESEPRSGSHDAVEGDVGRAAFFADNLVGQRTASGELFSNEAMTAAHASLRLGTKVRVTNLRNNKSVEVRINDRIPPGQNITITVTRTAAQQLGFLDAGFAPVRVEVVR